MLTKHERSININRKVLLEKLRENLKIHSQDFAEAVVGYKTKLLLDLEAKLAEVKGKTPLQLETVEYVQFSFPQSHEKEYKDVIEMLEYSVDENIELDSQSFKSYVKNEWSWSKGFELTANLYKSYNVGAAR